MDARHAFLLTMYISDKLLNCGLALVGRDSRVHAYVFHHVEITPHLVCQPCEIAQFRNQAHHLLHFLQQKTNHFHHYFGVNSHQ